MGMLEDDLSQFPPDYGEFERNVHFFHDQRGAKIPHSNRKFANTLCKMNSDVPESHITTDPTLVTCKLCRSHRGFKVAINTKFGKFGKEQDMATVKQGSKEHIDIVRAPLLAQIQELQKQVHEAVEARIGRERENEEHSRTIRSLLSDNKELKDANNDLRSRLMASELAYAKLRGYLEGKLDSEPPVMVPQQREPFHARSSDATYGTTSLDWRQDGSGRTSKHWYHR